MPQLIPYLNFNNNCREALEFYRNCLGGSLQLQTVGEMPEMAAQMPPEMKNSILHGALTGEGFAIYASDLNREQRLEGNNFSLCLNCSSESEVTTFFEKLSAGGSVIQPLAPMPWGALYGELKDRFGLTWLLNFGQA